ncbi:MAG: B12-binding domain-containing radical SAM protein [Thermoplasmata archaeon]
MTGSAGMMSDYGGMPYWAFASALPDEFFRSFMENWLFPTRSNEEGRIPVAPLALSKVESILLHHGFTRDQVIIADPRRLDEVVGPRTRVLGLTTMDPLGVSFGSGIMYVLMRLLGYTPKGGPFTRRAFLEVLQHPSLGTHRPKVIIGGPAVWQFLDLTNPSEWGIDCVMEGEGEKTIPEVFGQVVRGDPIPSVVHGRPVPAEDIPPIITPSTGGMVEITRGCGRGCKFCHPTLLAFRSMPLEAIEKEVRLNVEAGTDTVCLHSEEFFRYGVRGLTPDPAQLRRLLERISRITGEEVALETDFSAAATIMSKPEVVPLAAEYMTQDRWSYIEMGIETPSPRLIKQIMPGKVLPYQPEEYGDVVEQAVGLLNDHRWLVCATMIINIPGEREEDVIAALELMDRLKGYKVTVHALPFIPMGALRKRPQTVYDEVLANPLQTELMIQGFLLTNRTLQGGEGRRLACRGTSSLLSYVTRHGLLWATASYATKKLEARLHALRRSLKDAEPRARSVPVHP